MPTTLFSVAVMAMLLVSSATAQRTAVKRPAAKTKKPVVFAVLNNGEMIEVIGYRDRNKITTAIDGASKASEAKAFHQQYFKPGTAYKLVFGGVDAGSVSVTSSDPTAECITNMARVKITSPKVKLSGFRMALATDLPAAKIAGTRRMPTPAERTAADELVRAEFEKQKVGGKKIDYHNLTAIDIDRDGKYELVGTFWTNVAEKTRALLFFIADKDADGKYSIGHMDFRSISEDDVMNGEIASVDDGIYHERLLDYIDIDGDGTAEVFTYIQSFEGAGFNVYSRKDGKWSLNSEVSLYHCGY